MSCLLMARSEEEEGHRLLSRSEVFKSVLMLTEEIVFVSIKRGSARKKEEPITQLFASFV